MSTNSLVKNFKTPWYLFSWGVISVVSSFNEVLRLDFSFVENKDFYGGIIGPMMIWIIAFFIDYVYTISKIEKDEELDKEWTQGTYIIVCFIFLVLLLSFYHHTSVSLKITWMCLLFISIMSLKAASLCIVRPRIELKTV